MNYNIDSERKPHKSWMVFIQLLYPGGIGIWKNYDAFFFSEGWKPRVQREELFWEIRQETTTTKPTCGHRAGAEPRLHCWEASTRATTSSLLAKKSLEKNSSSADIQVTHFTCWLRRVYKLIKLQTFSFFLAFSFGKESLGRLESLSGIATSDAKDTSLMHICFTPDSDTRSIFSSWM